MEETKITNNDIANAIIELNTHCGKCDEHTAKGFKTSKKKDILNSTDDCSLSRFNAEITKRQDKKK